MTPEEIKDEVARKNAHANFKELVELEGKLTIVKVMDEAMLLYAEEKQPKWISVNERLPELNENVLCVQKSHDIPLMAHYCEDGFKVKKYVSEGDRVMVAYWTDVTHWIPLPPFKP